MGKQRAAHVYLDVRHLNTEKFRKRFPMISRLCEEFDIAIEREPIPVRPAAHYMIGGVLVDEEARSRVAGLFACGEAASTGVHGANRLASNSLLEGLVFGTVAGTIAAEEAQAEQSVIPSTELQYDFERTTRTVLDLTDVRNSLRSLMWRNVGIERHAARLAETLDIIGFWGRYVLDKLFDEPSGWETQNMLMIARLITQAAGAREESRGVHYRSDFPETRTAYDGQHLVVNRTPEGATIIQESVTS
jgi:L-aspartate oxidase